MPIYELECTDCNVKEDIISSYDDYISCSIVCDKCLKPMSKPISTGSFKLLGDGFYSPSKTTFD